MRRTDGRTGGATTRVPIEVGERSDPSSRFEVPAKAIDGNIRNDRIFLHALMNLLFFRFRLCPDRLCWPYGNDGRNPVTQERWIMNMPLQRPLDTRRDGTGGRI